MEAHDIRMRIKTLIQQARNEQPEFTPIGDVDEDDITLEALIHPERFEILIKLKGDQVA